MGSASKFFPLGKEYGSIPISTLGILEIKSIAGDRHWFSLARLLGSQEPDHIRYFTPFAFDEKTLRVILLDAKLDVYLGLFSEGFLIGLAMLRGWDKGYAIPAVGIMVDESYLSRGFASAGLSTLLAICKLRSSEKVMAKVYEKNSAALRLFLSHGFVAESIDKDGKVLFFRNLSYGT